VELVFYHDMTIEEAARTAGLSVGTARVHYDRGKKRLRSILESGESRERR
jgi:DNA-directed RNA polymerase specialized sigma24 family protein